MVRFKNRWLLVEFLPIGLDIPANNTLSNLTSKQVFHALKDSVLYNFGDAGWGAVGSSLTVKYFSPMTGTCIVRVGREHVRTAWGAITLLTTLEGHKVLPHVIHCSGTIKHVQLAAIEHNRELMARFRARSAAGGTEVGSHDIADKLEASNNEIVALQD